jgi:hypothetical protein
MEPYETIENHDIVVAAFGQWPSFHDGEVLRIVLDRMSRAPSGSYIPTLELHIRGWIMTSEVTAAGFYKAEHDSVVTFLFEDVFNLELEGFNQQNVLSSLNLTLIDEAQEKQALHVELEHCYVFSGEFTARRAKVLGVQPYVKTDA